MASCFRWLRVPALPPAVNAIVASRRRHHGEDPDGSTSPVPVSSHSPPQWTSRSQLASAMNNASRRCSSTALATPSKFTDAGEVRIAAGARDGHFAVSVTDTVSGCPPHEDAQFVEAALALPLGPEGGRPACGNDRWAFELFDDHRFNALRRSSTLC